MAENKQIDKFGEWIVYERKLTDGSPVYAVGNEHAFDSGDEQIRAIDYDSAVLIAECLRDHAA